jgi:3-phosphoglycerate kinase
MIRTLKAFDLESKNVLIRVDFNTPMDGEVV